MLTFVTVTALIQLASSAPAAGPSGKCICGGDPFYTTFDGERLEFQGRCNYLLMGTGEQESLPGNLKGFNVLVNNKKALGSERAYTDKVHIDVLLHRFSLRENGQIYIDDVPRTSDAETQVISNITLTKNLHAWKEGPKMLVRADSMFTLSADLRGPTGRHVIEIFNVNPAYKGYIRGICGNWNGKADDDHIPNGMDEAGTDVEIGNSWIVDGGECV